MFEEMDARLGAVRNALRNGERIENAEKNVSLLPKKSRAAPVLLP